MAILRVNVVKGGSTNFTTAVPASDAKVEYIQEKGISNLQNLSNSGSARSYFDYNNGIAPYPIPYWCADPAINLVNQTSDAD